MKKILALLFLFSALPLFGQGTSFPVFNRQGWTMAGAVVGTCQGPANPGTATLYCTSPVTTYTDWTLVVPCTQVTTIPNPPGPPLGPVSGVGCTNPGLTDSHGNATIFAANGFYWALVSGYQVVPQTFPFSIGGGGGGGGGNPCGTTYDVQLNISNGFGCDTGIFIETPSNHTTYNNVFSANTQLDVSDSANTGVVDIGHSTGTVVDGHFQMSLSPTFVAPGYGIDWPDAAPASGSSLTATGSVDGSGRYLTHWASAVAGLVSLENLPYIYTDIPCNSPATCSDLAPIPVPYAANTFYAGPRVNTGGVGYLTNTAVAGDNSGTLSSASVTLPYPTNAGDPLVFINAATTVSTPTDSCGNTWVATANGHAWYVAAAVPCTHTNVITQALGGAANFEVGAGEVLGGGVLDVQASAGSCGVVSGKTYPVTFNSLTTTNIDTLVTLFGQGGGAQTGLGVYAGTNGLLLENQGSIDGGGGLGTSMSVALGWQPALTVGSNHTTMNYTYTGSSNLCSGAVAITLAFKPSVTVNPANPTSRQIYMEDLERNILTVPSDGDGLVFDAIYGMYYNLVFGSGLSYNASTHTLSTTSGGTVTSVSGTTNQVDVATGTTTPVISLDSSLIFPGTITMGAHAADFGTATTFKIPTGAGATSSADGLIAYDTTAKSTHVRTNGADSITATFASAPAGTKCLHTNGTTGLITETAGDCGSGSGTVTSVSGTTNQIDVATGTTTPVISLDGQFTSVNYGTCTNTADALTVTLSPAPTSLVNGLTVRCKASAANTTTTPTLSPNGLTAHTIVKAGNSGQAALVANDILTNMVATYVYNSATTTWELQNPQQQSSGGVTSVALAAPSDILAVSGSPVTTTGTLTLTKQNQNAGYFWKGQPSGTQVPFLVQNKVCDLAAAVTLTCTLNAPTSAGHLVVVHYDGTHTVSSVTDSASNSYTQVDFINNFEDQYMHYFPNVGAGVTSVSVTQGASGAGIVVVQEWANVATASPLDVHTNQNFNACSAGIVTLSSVTTTNANDLIIGAAVTSAAQTYTAGTGYTLISSTIGSSGPGSIGVEYTNVGSTGTYTPTLGCVNNSQGITAAFKALPTPASSAPIFSPIFAADLVSVAVGPTFNISGVLQNVKPHTVIGTCTLGTSCSVTLTGDSTFTSSTSYQCTATDQTSAAAVKFAPSSGSAFALTGTGTDVLSFICVGD